MSESKNITDILEYFREIGIDEISRSNLSRVNEPAATAAGRKFEPESTRRAEALDSIFALESSDPKSPPPSNLILPAQSGSLFVSETEGKSGESLEMIRADLGDCRRCKLAPLRKNIVFGSGNPQAALMFIGEAPGADEDEQGLPFVGRAGQLLTKIIEAISLKRQEVYICNIIKCRPPNNRTPERDEIDACEPFLIRQIHAVRPKVIVCLGSPAMQTLLKTKTGITQLRGQWVEFQGAKLMATFHPAYCLRWPDKKKEVWEDMKKVRDYLRFAGVLQ